MMVQKLQAFAAAHASFQEELFVARYRHPFLVVHRQEANGGAEEIGFKTTAINLRKALLTARQDDPDVYALADSGKGMVAVGRAPNNAIVLPDPAISKFHAYFREDVLSNAFTITDPGSRNGTKVNGAKLTPKVGKALKGGETIEFSESYRGTFHTARSLYLLISRVTQQRKSG